VGDHADIVARAYDAFARRDLAAMSAVIDDHIHFHAPTARFAGAGGPYVGHAGMAEYFEDAARVWEVVRPEPRDYYELDGGRVLVVGRVYAWGGGNVIDAPASWVWRLRDGRIDYCRVHESTRAALHEVGLDAVPGSPSRSDG
jgi:ketosteroid isomerase-like protein